MADEKKRDYAIEMGEQKPNGHFESSSHAPPMASTPAVTVTSSPVVPILAYCGSSILMTVTNKYVLSGLDFNLNFFLLCVQVCASSLQHLFIDNRTDTLNRALCA